MPEEGYVNVSLPEDIIKIVDRIIEKGKAGYKSRPEVINDAVRRLAEELKPLVK